MEVEQVRIATPLRSQVEEARPRAIAEGELMPATRLVEQALCERFAFSRPLMRMRWGTVS